GKKFADVDLDSFKLILKEKDINAAVVIEIVTKDEHYQKKKGKSKKDASNKVSTPNQNGDFQFAAFAINTNQGKAIYEKDLKAIYVKVQFRTLDKIIREE